MGFKKLWPQPMHTDRWCADMPILLEVPGKPDQEARLTNFSVSAVRIDGVSGLVDGGKAWLRVGQHERIPVCVIWVAGTTAGCRFVGRVGPEVLRTIAKAAKGTDRTVISAEPPSASSSSLRCHAAWGITHEQ